MDVNKVEAGGRAGKEPDLRYLATGTAICTFTVAVTEKYKDKELTEWFNVLCWGKTAEFAGKYVRKGARVLINGKQQTTKYTTKEGDTRYKTELVANDIQVIDWPEQSENMRKQPDTEPDMPFNPDDGEVPF